MESKPRVASSHIVSISRSELVKRVNPDSPDVDEQEVMIRLGDYLNEQILLFENSDLGPIDIISASVASYPLDGDIRFVVMILYRAS
jgi:hypothetical protein